MNLKRIFGLYLPLALVASLVIPLTVEVIFSAGNLNLMVRNIFSFEQAIPDFEWEGKEYLDVSYSPDYETDCLDLYVPTSNTKPKLITLIHGGGFLFNDSRSRPCRFLYQYFRAKGYACASINYRLATESTFPGAVEDCKAAIKFLKLNADYYGYDASKMVVWGESAGGYLATMLSVINDEEFNGVRFEGQNDSNINTTAKIDVLLSYYGLINFDLVNKDFDNLGVWPLLRYFAGNVGDDDPKKSYVGSFLGKRIKDLSQEELDNVTPNTRINENIYIIRI